MECNSSHIKCVINVKERYGGNLTWKSSNLSVATVDENGKVVGIAEGASIISSESVNGIKGIANAKVLAPIAEPEPELEPTEPEGS